MTRILATTAALLSSLAATAQAGTLTTSLAAFAAGAGGLVNSDTSAGVADGSTVASVPLAGGATLTFGPAITKDNLTDDAALPAFADGYAGDVFEANAATVTVSVPGGALGFTVYTGSTDFFGTASYTATVTASDGQSVNLTLPTYDPAGGDVGQFVGYFGGPTTLTVTSTDPNLFTIAEIVDAPEPATFVILAGGLLGLGLTRRARG